MNLSPEPRFRAFCVVIVGWVYPDARPTEGRFLHLSNFCDILSAVLPVTVGGSPVLRGVIFFAPDSQEKGVSNMITWSELFQFCALIIALVALVVQIIDNKKK